MNYYRFLVFLFKVKYLLSFSIMVNPSLNPMPLLIRKDTEMADLDGSDHEGGNEIEVHPEVGSSNIEALNPYIVIAPIR